jgi:hypothetical protein
MLIAGVVVLMIVAVLAWKYVHPPQSRKKEPVVSKMSVASAPPERTLNHVGIMHKEPTPAPDPSNMMMQVDMSPVVPSSSGSGVKHSFRTLPGQNNSQSLHSVPRMPEPSPHMSSNSIIPAHMNQANRVSGSEINLYGSNGEINKISMGSLRGKPGKCSLLNACTIYATCVN